MQIIEADIDDALIDLEMNDCVDIVRVFSSFVEQPDNSHVPALFDRSEPQF